MQRTERYAAVALMFFVAILIVGYFWDDGEPDDTSGEVMAAAPADSTFGAERADVRRIDEEAVARQRAQEERRARVRRAQAEEQADQAGRTSRSEGASNGGAASSMPISGQDDVAEDFGRVTTATIGTEHRMRPGGAVAQGADELKGLSRPLLDAPVGRGGASAEEPPAMGSLNSRAPRQGRTGRSQDQSTRNSVASSSQGERGVRKSDASTSSADRRKTAAKPPRTAKATYTVKPGDALQRIAKNRLGDASRAMEIASLNGLTNPDMIRAGMQLTLPDSVVAQSTKKSAASPVAAKGKSVARGTDSTVRPGREYTIRKDESLSVALHRELGTYKRSISLVKALNPGLNPDKVRAGQKIRLPLPEDIPGQTLPKSAPTRSPSLSTSTAGSRLADASGPRSTSAKRARPARTDSEFVVR